jgi:hypothetical protein
MCLFRSSIVAGHKRRFRSKASCTVCRHSYIAELELDYTGIETRGRTRQLIQIPGESLERSQKQNESRTLGVGRFGLVSSRLSKFSKRKSLYEELFY